MPTPNILLVIEGTYPWYRGGVSEWVHQYIKAFDFARFSILQIATDEYRNASLDQAIYEVPGYVDNFVRIRPPSLNFKLSNGLEEWFQKYFNHISRLAQEADCVHVANTGFAGWLGMRLAGDHQKPLVLTEHALYWKEVEMGAVALECGYKIPDHEQGREQVSALFQDIARRVYRASDQVISVSECNIPEQKAMGAQDPKYIPNGVDESWIKNEKTRSQPLTIGWIGRCAEMKNPLRFFEVINAIGPEAQFVMMLCDAGEEELKEQVIVRARQHPNVDLIWNRPAIEHIDEMDLLCITSHNESQPLVLFEALARKVLPTGWQVGDVTSKYAVTVDQDASTGALAQRIWNLWNRPGQWKSELNRRFERVTKQHTWQAIFEQYEEVLGFEPSVVRSE